MQIFKSKLFSLGCLLLGCVLALPCMGQTTSSEKVAGWANVPGGKQVWLRPGLDAYEHSTGLVRDLQTGQKSAPITPDTVDRYPNRYPNRYPLTPPMPPIPFIAPAPPRSPYAPYYQPYYQPYVLPRVAPPAYTPPTPYYHSGYDYGPNNVYGNSGQPCNGCGSKLGAPGSINSRWTRVK